MKKVKIRRMMIVLLTMMVNNTKINEDDTRARLSDVNMSIIT